MKDQSKQEELGRLKEDEACQTGERQSEEKGIDKNKLELILDVPVKSRVVVGKTTQKLAELLNLKPGMIIETKNLVTEDVEFHVNDNVIALGEVVVAGEHYGLRVKQIINPVERIRKLQ